MRKMNEFGSKLHGFLCEIWLLPVKIYRKWISPLKPTPSCRFTPTCSAYAIEAVKEWGILVGSVLALWRLVRCNPFSKGGEDPVPKRRKKSKPDDDRK